MNIKVSLIVPVYNAAHLLLNTLGNMILQSLGTKEEGSFEAIFIDDASTDASADILRSLEAQYPDIVRLKVLDKNGGQGAARNIGLDLARGEYIAFVDCDDMIDPMYCEKLYAAATPPSAAQTPLRSRNSPPDCFTVGAEPTSAGRHAPLERGGEKADIIECYYYDEAEKRFVCTVPEDCRGAVNDVQRCKLVAEGGFVWGKLIRRAFLTDNNMRFREGDILEDVDFSTELYARVQVIEAVEEPLYIYKDNAGSSTKKKGGQIFFETIIRGVEEMFVRMKTLDNYEAVKPGAEAVYLVYYSKALEEVEGLKATGFLDGETERQLIRTMRRSYRGVITLKIEENPYAIRQLPADRLERLSAVFEGH